jgi:hypothetical protein
MHLTFSIGPCQVIRPEPRPGAPESANQRRANCRARRSSYTWAERELTQGSVLTEVIVVIGAGHTLQFSPDNLAVDFKERRVVDAPIRVAGNRVTFDSTDVGPPAPATFFWGFRVHRQVANGLMTRHTSTREITAAVKSVRCRTGASLD